MSTSRGGYSPLSICQRLPLSLAAHYTGQRGHTQMTRVTTMSHSSIRAPGTVVSVRSAAGVSVPQTAHGTGRPMRDSRSSIAAHTPSRSASAKIASAVVMQLMHSLMAGLTERDQIA